MIQRANFFILFFCATMNVRFDMKIYVQVSLTFTLFVFKHIFFVSSTITVLSFSSNATRTRARILAEEIGSWHLDVSIDGVVSALLSLFHTLTGKRPRYKVKG